MSKGKKFLSDLKFVTDYSKWRPEFNRYESWEESCEAVVNTHRVKYASKLDILKEYINEAEQSYKDKLVFASQRNLQFRGEQIFKHNTRLYNCAAVYMDKTQVFSQVSYLSLSGCGVGISMLRKWVGKLPTLTPRKKEKIKNFIIPDSIEGWSDAFGILVSSFCSKNSHFKEYEGSIVRFDYSQIRPKGAMIAGGFKAPGPAPLKQAIERIESLLENEIKYGETKFRSIICYDTLMHIADAILSAGVRRSALSIIIDPQDLELLNAKTGNWRDTNKQRERSNNSVGLIRGSFSEEYFTSLVKKNNGMSDIGFIFLNNEYEVMNPCAEISFTPILDLKREITGVSLCNLSEINGKACKTKEKFLKACKSAAIFGTLQAGYTDFSYLGSITEEIVRKEALIGVSITGWMNTPDIFNEEWLQDGINLIELTNRQLAEILEINPAARLTTVKPSGNISVLIGCSSGIHPEHSKRYFRIMQLNKESDTAKWLIENNPDIIEESVWSANNTDYVVYSPVENELGTIYKDVMRNLMHLEKIKFVQENWVMKGQISERCIMPKTQNNVSCTVIIDDYDEVAKYVFDNQNVFTAVSFLSEFGDKDYPQAPFTSVLNSEELLEKYGDAVIFASGLIVDGLHYFDQNLWEACLHVTSKEKKVDGTRTEVLLKKDWIRRAKQFSKNYFKNDVEKMIYCLKDVHLWYKWNKIAKSFKEVDFEKILTAPTFNDVSDYGAVSCSGGACEITRI